MQSNINFENAYNVRGDELLDPEFQSEATPESLTLNFNAEVSHKWTRLSDCPGECSKHTVVHHQKSLYIFGGDDGGRSMLNHLLVYDIATNSWRQPTCRGTPPAARYHHSAVVAGSSMLVFGGYTGDLPSNPNLTNKNDLFEFKFNTSEWREWKFTPGCPMPLPRSAHGAAVHDNKLWIFAGYDGNKRLNDMWYVSLGAQYQNSPQHCQSSLSSDNMSVWNPPCGVSPLTGQANNFCSYCPACMESGPSTSATVSGLYLHHHDRHQHHPAASTAVSSVDRRDGWVEVNQSGDIPPTVCNFALTVARDCIYLFSGHSGVRIRNNLFQFNFATTCWTRIYTEHLLCGGIPAPEQRYGHTMVAHNRYLYVFGGATGGSELAYQLYCYDLDSQTWSLIELAENSEQPAARLFHAATMVGSKLYIVGGITENNVRSREVFSISVGDLPACTLREDFKKMLQRQLLTDIQFVVSNNKNRTPPQTDEDATNRRNSHHKEDVIKIPAHIAIVAARSPFLRDKIREAKDKRRSSDIKSSPIVEPLEVHLSDVEASPMKMIIDCIYTDRICTAEPKQNPYAIHVVILMIKLYELALRFQIQRLCNNFGAYFESLLTIDNVLVSLQTAWSLKLNDLVNICIRFIIKDLRYDSVVMSPEFEELDKQLIIEIVRRRKRRSGGGGSNEVFRRDYSSASYLSELNDRLCVTHTGKSDEDKHLFENNLEQDLESFLNSPMGEEFSDVSIVFTHGNRNCEQSCKTSSSLNNTGGKQFHLHRAILTARSSYFEAMFRCTNSMKLSNEKTLSDPIEVQLSPALAIAPSFSAQQSLIRYIYCGDIRMPPQDSLYLFSTPYYLGFSNTRLQLACKQNLQFNITVDTILDVLEAAHNVEAHEMKQHALRIIRANSQKISRSTTLHNLSKPVLIEIIQALSPPLHNHCI